MNSPNRLRRLFLVLAPAVACSSLLIAQQPAPGAPPASPAAAAPQPGRGGRGAPPV